MTISELIEKLGGKLAQGDARKTIEGFCNKGTASAGPKRRKKTTGF